MYIFQKEVVDGGMGDGPCMEERIFPRSAVGVTRTRTPFPAMVRTPTVFSGLDCGWEGGRVGKIGGDSEGRCWDESTHPHPVSGIRITNVTIGFSDEVMRKREG